jgi:hypothetical protein
MSAKPEYINMSWKLNTKTLLSEVLANPGWSTLATQIQLLAKLLDQVSDRCAEINDPELDHLMCQLTLYECSDVNSDQFDLKILEAIAERARNAE